MIFNKLLSKRDAITLLELIHTSLLCSNEEDFKGLVNKLHEVISYDFAVSGAARTDDCGNILSYKIINLNYPADWLKLYAEKEFFKIDNVVKENFTSFNLQRWKDTFRKRSTSKEFVFHAEDFGLRDGFTHGQKNPAGNTGSLLSISGNSVEYNARTEMILELIIPHLHHAIIRIIDQGSAGNIRSLSKREIEVLNWLRQGKSSWDISTILHISVRTIKFHTKNIMKKLGVVNRAHAVAVAIEQGLINIG